MLQVLFIKVNILFLLFFIDGNGRLERWFKRSYEGILLHFIEEKSWRSFFKRLFVGWACEDVGVSFMLCHSRPGMHYDIVVVVNLL